MTSWQFVMTWCEGNTRNSAAASPHHECHIMMPFGSLIPTLMSMTIRIKMPHWDSTMTFNTPKTIAISVTTLGHHGDIQTLIITVVSITTRIAFSPWAINIIDIQNSHINCDVLDKRYNVILGHHYDIYISDNIFVMPITTSVVVSSWIRWYSRLSQLSWT